MNATARKLFANDYAAMLALSDARKAENKAARERCMANAELAAHLKAEAERRGETFSWDDYFSNAGIP